jgi:hypothetical protein
LEALGAVTIFQTASFPVPDPTKTTTYSLNGEYAAVSLTIPAGAWPEGAPGPTLTVFDETSLRRRRAGGAAGAVLAGRAVNFGPEGIKFKKPVSIALPYDKTRDYGTRKLYVHKYATYPNGSQWEIRPYSLSVVDPINAKFGTVTADTPSFSAYAVLALPPDVAQVSAAAAITTTPAPTTTPKPNVASLEVYWIIVGLVAPVLCLGVPAYIYVTYRIKQERARRAEEKQRMAEEEEEEAKKHKKKKHHGEEEDEDEDEDEGGGGSGGKREGEAGVGVNSPSGPPNKGPNAAPAAPLAVEPAASLLQAGSVRGELVFDSKASSLLQRDLAGAGKEEAGEEEAGIDAADDDAHSVDPSHKSNRSKIISDQAGSAPQPKARSSKGVKAVASHRYVAESGDELSFEKGAILTIVGDGGDDGWLQAIDSSGNKGYVPLSRLHHSKAPAAVATTAISTSTLPPPPKPAFAIPSSPAEAQLKAPSSSEDVGGQEEGVADGEGGGGGGGADLVLGPRIV